MDGGAAAAATKVAAASAEDPNMYIDAPTGDPSAEDPTYKDAPRHIYRCPESGRGFCRGPAARPSDASPCRTEPNIGSEQRDPNVYVYIYIYT